MIKRKELTEPKSCLNKAGSEEPIFVLRAKDAVAAQAVEHWATMAERIHESERIAEARKLAEEMRAWRKKHVTEPAKEVLAKTQ